jgi:hypothetical protein
MEILGVSSTLLVLAGSAAVVSAAAIAIAAYYDLFRSIFNSGKSAPKTPMADITASAPVHEIQSSGPIRVEEPKPATEAPVQEAPAPFPEESLPTPAPSVPADIGALAPVSSVAVSASPVVVIATPKRKPRSSPKRLPNSSASGTPRRKKAPKSTSTSELVPTPLAVTSGIEPAAAPSDTPTSPEQET